MTDDTTILYQVQSSTETHHYTTDELTHALAHLGYRFRLNAIDDTIEVNGNPLTDILAAKIRCDMRDLNPKFPRNDTLKDVWSKAASDNEYHPVRDYLNIFPWDNEPRIDALANHFQDMNAGPNDPCPVFRLWLKRWLVGSVAKVMQPGMAQNAMLVLDGPQNLGKSYFVRWLCPLPQYFVEGAIDTADKDSYIRLINSFIWEVSELGATTRRSDREALKSFISTRIVTVRRPYGHFDLKKPALANLIGTINNEAGFLSDPTGNRRFLVVTLTGIDWNYSQLDVNQIWAEAVHLYRNGERWELSPEEINLRDGINQGYEVEDPILNWLEKYYLISPDDCAEFTATAEIVQYLQDNGMRGITRQIQMNFATLAKRLGLKPGRLRGERGYFGIMLKPEYRNKQDSFAETPEDIL